MSDQRTDRYEIEVTFLDGGEYLVQVEGVPYPLGVFKETGWDLERLLRAAGDAIVADRNRQAL